jgi:hypothetical protein
MRWIWLLGLIAACSGEPDPNQDGDADTDTDSDADTDSDTDADTDADALSPTEGGWTGTNEIVTADACNLYTGDDDAFGMPAVFTVADTDAGFDVTAVEWQERGEAADATEASGTLACVLGGANAFSCSGRLVYWDLSPDAAEMWSDVTWSGTLSDASSGAVEMHETLDCTGADCSTIAYWGDLTFPCTTSHTFDVVAGG